MPPFGPPMPFGLIGDRLIQSLRNSQNDPRQRIEPPYVYPGEPQQLNELSALSDDMLMQESLRQGQYAGKQMNPTAERLKKERRSGRASEKTFDLGQMPSGYDSQAMMDEIVYQKLSEILSRMMMEQAPLGQFQAGNEPPGVWL